MESGEGIESFLSPHLLKLPDPLVESGEGIERFILRCWRSRTWISWNPVKELKAYYYGELHKYAVGSVESGEGIESGETFEYRNILIAEVESGEGIESMTPQTYRSSVALMWNPVKELKDLCQQSTNRRIRYSVESGEGIERTPAAGRGARRDQVESGEGIERKT